MDEITTTGKTFISEYNGQEIFSYDIEPTEVGIAVAKPEDLKGGHLEDNVRIFNDILDGEKRTKTGYCHLNAAYALYIADKVKNIEDGIKLANESIDSKKARLKLEQLKDFTHGRG